MEINNNEEIIKSVSDEKIVKLINGYKKQMERNKIWNKNNPDKIREMSHRYYNKVQIDNPEKYQEILKQKRESYYRSKERKKLEELKKLEE